MKKRLKVGCSSESINYFRTSRDKVLIKDTDLTDVSVCVLSASDNDLIKKVLDTEFEIPLIVFADGKIKKGVEKEIYLSIDKGNYSRDIVDAEIENAALQYEERMLPVFFETLTDYKELNNIPFDCPGHQGGEYFKKHPAGRYLVDFLGENIFKTDICNADVALGDLLIHEGPAQDALKNAASVFNSDKTYFVMNGTSTSNNVVLNALVREGDLVLFDRNNHKSIYDSALIKTGGEAIFLETARNPLGFIGGIDEYQFNEKYLMDEIKKQFPDRPKSKRPFRVAVIQLGTYDGTIYNAGQVLKSIGHLCEYILFDSAWVGYEQFIKIMEHCSPLLLDLKENDPGIFVTQSVHKQQAGFSQSSYIHKKDSHIKDKPYYINDRVFNTSYRLNASTSPFYPIFASLDVNARMQDRKVGKKLWNDCLKVGIDARKKIFEKCTMLKPFVPPTVGGKPWQDYDTEEISKDIKFFEFKPGDKWHSFEGYGKGQYFVDPNKFLLTTPGIDLATGKYENFGIPAAILANYLRDNRIIPEKNDFNSILFLMTPAESKMKMDVLINQLVRFEHLIEKNATVSEVLPYLYSKNMDRYRGYTIRQLCQEMHDFYKENNAKDYQKKLFRKEFFPKRYMNAKVANLNLLKNNFKLVPVRESVGEVALEGALPYPPGIFCVAPGEVWNEIAVKYFQILEEGINNFPGFAPEIHGVYFEEENGKQVAKAYVLDKAKEI